MATELDMSELYQIYYDDSQIKSLYPFAIPFENKELTIFFENSVLSKLVMSTTAKNVSVCSWRLREKFRWYIGRPREITEELLNSDYDVMSFTKNTQHHQMLAAADKWHPGFRDSMKKIGGAIGIKIPNEVKIPIYQNHFSAKREIYQDYVRNYLNPAMKVMKEDNEINKLAMTNSKYSELDKSSPEKLDRLERLIGVRFYPLAPFLLERLFSIYIHNQRIQVTWL